MSSPTGAFIWYELVTGDADAAQAFYSEVIGWRIGPSDTPGMDYRLASADDAQVDSGRFRNRGRIIDHGSLIQSRINDP